MNTFWKESGEYSQDAMDTYEYFRSEFETASDPEKAVSMSAYMRNQFHFYGIPSPERKAVYAEFLKSEKKSKTIDWNLCDQCFRDDHREFQVGHS